MRCNRTKTKTVSQPDTDLVSVKAANTLLLSGCTPNKNRSPSRPSYVILDLTLRKKRQLNILVDQRPRSQPLTDVVSSSCMRFIFLHSRNPSIQYTWTIFPSLLSFSHSRAVSNRYNHVAPMGDRGNMKAIKDPHTFICSRRCQLGAWELSEEGSDKYTHFNHDQVGCNASSRT